MATEFVYLKGKSKYCRVYNPDSGGDYEPCWYTLLYLTPESLEKFKTLGVKNEIKMDDDGQFVRLRRPVEKEIKGRMTKMAPPIVIDKFGKAMSESIGDTSDITCKCEYYPYTFNKKKGHAIRLHTVRVDNLVPYNPPKLTDENMEEYNAEKLTTGETEFF